MNSGKMVLVTVRWTRTARYVKEAGVVPLTSHFQGTKPTSKAHTVTVGTFRQHRPAQWRISQGTRLGMRAGAVGQRATTHSTQIQTHKRFWFLKCCFASTETVGLLRAGAQDDHIDFHTALTHERSKKPLFIGTKHNMRIFEVIPFISRPDITTGWLGVKQTDEKQN